MCNNRGVSVAFNKSISSLLRDDEITAVMRSDWLILNLGMLIFYKHAESQKHFIGQYMRIMSGLLIHLREREDQRSAPLSDFIAPAKFDIVVAAVNSLCKMRTNKYKQP